MQKVAQAARTLLLVILLFGGVVVVVNYYPYIFAKNITGEILEVERVTPPGMIVGSGVTAAQMFSFAVMIKAQDGELYHASSEDRQWSIAKKGYCVEAKFYPYAPWSLDKAGTWFNARLTKVMECSHIPGFKASGAAAVPAPVQGDAGKAIEPVPTPATEATPGQPEPAK